MKEREKRMSLIDNLRFDFAFLTMLKNDEREQTATGGSLNAYFNGVPFQHYILFKTICLMPETKEGLTTRAIADTCEKVFGYRLLSPSVSRAIESLKKVNLVSRINNPFNNQRYSWVKLSSRGLKLKAILKGDNYDKFKISNMRELESNIVETPNFTISKEKQ